MFTPSFNTILPEPLKKRRYINCKRTSRCRVALQMVTKILEKRVAYISTLKIRITPRVVTTHNTTVDIASAVRT
jgi:hypothetical protein